MVFRKHKKESKWLVADGRKVRCYLCGKKILRSDLHIYHQETHYFSHQACDAEIRIIGSNGRRQAVKKIAIGAAVVGAVAAGIDKVTGIYSEHENGSSPATQTILTSQGLIPPALTSDPANPVPGQMWYRSDAGVMAHFDAVQNRVVYSSEINDGNVNVTSKGIINGLSVLPNDGKGGFGPDTTKGATSPGQCGSPYTETYGIQEAINSLPYMYSSEYSMNIQVGKIFIKAGVYNCTDTIFISPYSQIEINGEVQAATVFQSGYPDIGTGVYIDSTGVYGAISETTNSATQLVGHIELRNLYIQYTLPSSQTYIQTTSSGGGGAIINLQQFNENIMIDIRAGTQSLIDNQSVINAGVGNDNLFYIDRVFTNAPSSMSALTSNSNHLHIGFMAISIVADNGPINGFNTANNKVNGIIQLGGYDTKIDQLHIFGTVYNILYTAPENAALPPTGYSSLLINQVYLEIGTPTQTTGFYPFSIYKNVIIENFIMGPGSTYNPLTDATNNYVVPMIIKSTNNVDSVLPPSTPTVPASGTAQENTNPYPVDVYLYGGAVTEIQVTKNGTAYTVFSNSSGLALSGQAYRLKPLDSITVTYTTAPTWEWLAE